MNETNKFHKIVTFIKQQYPNRDFIPMHEPVFIGNERNYVIDAIDSTFVSSIGSYVDRFEEMMTSITGAKHAVAIVNGTNALHMGLVLAGVKRGDEVLSQALTFIATANAISYVGATPIFIDVENDTLGMSPDALINFLKTNVELRSDGSYNKLTGKKIAACVPMHTFGFPCRIEELAFVCKDWKINLIEDAAESLGSYYKNKHTGMFGEVGVFSFNGNKTVTSGGGGALVTNDEGIAKRAKHLTTQAKVPHRWEFVHDDIGYNYRMPNLNAALACAQLEQLELFVKDKRKLAIQYSDFFNDLGIIFCKEPANSRANYWLNTLILNDLTERNAFLEYTNGNGVMTRPVWELMNQLAMYKDCQTDGLENSRWLAERIVNIPSGFRNI